MSVALPVVTAAVGSAGPIHLPTITAAVGSVSPLRLPKIAFNTGASTLLHLPSVTAAAGGVSALRLPSVTMTPILSYTHVATGGVQVTGSAPVVPVDPYIPTGGVRAASSGS